MKELNNKREENRSLDDFLGLFESDIFEGDIFEDDIFENEPNEICKSQSTINREDLEDLYNILIEDYDLSPRMTTYLIARVTQLTKEEVKAKLQNLPAVIMENLSLERVNYVINGLCRGGVGVRIIKA